HSPSDFAKFLGFPQEDVRSFNPLPYHSHYRGALESSPNHLTPRFKGRAWTRALCEEKQFCYQHKSEEPANGFMNLNLYFEISFKQR
ncbi:unnamed protein product, partial [Bubo scandiacus]